MIVEDGARSEVCWKQIEIALLRKEEKENLIYIESILCQYETLQYTFRYIYFLQ